MQSIIRKKSLISNNECVELFRLKQFPVHMLSSEDEKILYHDMIFGIDKSSGFIQLLETVPKNILYKDSHSNAIGSVWHKHHELLADIIYKINPETVLEIGGGTGLVESIFTKKNKKPIHWDIIEPEPHPVKESTAHFIKGFFPEAVDNTKSYELILHSHVLEHMEEPLDFFVQTASLLPIGKFMIFSVPYLEKLLAEKAVSVINFEHTCLLTEDFIDMMLIQTGFAVVNKIYYLNHSVIYTVQRNTPPLIHKSLHTDTGCSDSVYNYYDKYYHLFTEWTDFYTQHIAELNKKMTGIKKTVYFFGAHISAQFYKAFGLDFAGIAGILDNDFYKHNRKVSGLNHTVTAPAILKDVKSPAVIVPESPYKKEIKIQLQQINKNITFL